MGSDFMTVLTRGEVFGKGRPEVFAERALKRCRHSAMSAPAIGISKGLCHTLCMSNLTEDLQATLTEFDTDAAAKLERLLRDAIDLAQPSKASAVEVDANGWPVGHFEKFAGCLAGEQWDPPLDSPPEPTPEW